MGVREILQQALEAAKSIKDPGRHDSALSRIAELEANSGDIAGALEIVPLIDSYVSGENYRRNTLREIAKAQAKSNDLPGALHTLGTIKEESVRTDTLRDVSEILAAAGDISGALQVADEIKIDFSRDDALIKIAQQHARKGGDGQAVRQIAGKLKDTSRAKYIWISMALAQAERGDVEQARKFLSTLKKSERDFPLAGLARIQAEAGDVQGALETATQISSNQAKGDALASIRKVQEQAGDREGEFRTRKLALEDDLSSWNRGRRNKAVVALAIALAEKGDIQGALDTVTDIRPHPMSTDLLSFEKQDQADALIDIAYTQAKNGDSTGALKTARSIESLQLPADHLHAIPRTLNGKLQTAFRMIATAQVSAGDVEGAKQTVSLIHGYKPDGVYGERGDNTNIALALEEIVKGQADAGDVEGALHTVNTISIEGIRDNSVDAIVTAQLKAGDVKGALDTTAQMKGHKIQHYNQVAAYEAENGNVSRALAWINALTDPETKAMSLISIARVLTFGSKPLGPDKGARNHFGQAVLHTSHAFLFFLGSSPNQARV